MHDQVAGALPCAIVRRLARAHKMIMQINSFGGVFRSLSTIAASILIGALVGFVQIGLYGILNGETNNAHEYPYEPFCGAPSPSRSATCAGACAPVGATITIGLGK